MWQERRRSCERWVESVVTEWGRWEGEGMQDRVGGERKEKRAWKHEWRILPWEQLNTGISIVSK